MHGRLMELRGSGEESAEDPAETEVTSPLLRVIHTNLDGVPLSLTPYAFILVLFQAALQAEIRQYFGLTVLLAKLSVPDMEVNGML